MPRDFTDETKLWVETWKKAAPELEAIKRRELQEIDTQQALLNPADAFESCRLHFTPPPTSGLVEQQAWFQRLPRGLSCAKATASTGVTSINISARWSS